METVKCIAFFGKGPLPNGMYMRNSGKNTFYTRFDPPLLKCKFSTKATLGNIDKQSHTHKNYNPWNL